jgi:hypothetical protein
MEQKLAWFGSRSQTMSIMGWLVQGKCEEDSVGLVEHCCWKRLRPALSSHCRRQLLILLIAMRDPPIWRWAALTVAMLTRAEEQSELEKSPLRGLCFMA